jgi:G:T-mismatch repair DNA endonuclease (very short patch repair protein)
VNPPSVSLNKSLKIQRPDLVLEWDYQKNAELLPENVFLASSKKVWWKCQKGHNWKSLISNRTRREKPSGCPFCSGHRVDVHTCLATLSPQVAEQWHPTKNGELTTFDIGHSSRTKIWWVCDKGHEWNCSVSNRNKTNCPYCAGKKVNETNSLLFLFPDVATEWHPTKNGLLLPSQIRPGSNKKIWWMCTKDHEWMADPSSRTYRKDGCPYCSGKRTALENSLQTLFPLIAKQWHQTKNPGITPLDVGRGSNKQIWWICNKGHEWKTTVCNRTLQGQGCGHCYVPHASKKEISLRNELMIIFSETHSKTFVPGDNQKWKCDIVLSRLKIVVEYDGSYWHNGLEERDLRKTKSLSKAGWRVIRVREHPLAKIQSWDVQVRETAPMLEIALMVLDRIVKFHPQTKDIVNEYKKNGILLAEVVSQKEIQARSISGIYLKQNTCAKTGRFITKN